MLKIAEFIASIITSRDVADNPEKEILKTKSKIVNLDFFDVEFISRFAAHTLLSMKDDLQRRLIKKTIIIFVNANKEVREIFRIIAANGAMAKAKPDFKAEGINIINIVYFFYFF